MLWPRYLLVHLPLYNAIIYKHMVGYMLTFHVDQTKFALELGTYAMQYLTLQSSLDWVQTPSIHHRGRDS